MLSFNKDMEKDKIVKIFREIVGEKAEKLSGSFYPAYANTKITETRGSSLLLTHLLNY